MKVTLALDSRMSPTEDGQVDPTQGSRVDRPKPDLSGWYTAASIFWFEAWGLMGFGYVVIAPLMAFMHGTFPPSTWTDGSALGLLVLLVAVSLLSLMTWLVGGRYPRLRGWVFLLLGFAGLAGIGLALPYDPVVLLGVALWLGWPGIMLITVWGRFLRSSRPPTTRTAA